MTEPTNVLLLTVDSLRSDAVPRDGFGSELVRSTLGPGASETRFEHAFATGPGTTPSFPALLTGTMPLSYDGLGPLSADRPRVPALLGRAGYTTAGFQCNPFLSEHFAYHVGFDAFRDYQNPLMGIATKIFPRGIEINNPTLRRVDRYLDVTAGIRKAYQLLRGKPRPYVSADVITDDTIEWLDTVESPFFCWTHYMDVHHPCFPPEQYRERLDVATVSQSEVAAWYSTVLDDPGSLTDDERDRLRDLYRASIAYTEDQVARILTHLSESGRGTDTLVVLTSDHGELFGEHGQYGKPERLYDELLRVPLIVVNGPEDLGEATDRLVSLLDVPPLIHDALGLEVPDAYRGRRPGTDDPRRYVMAEHEVRGDAIVGARSAEWLYEGDEIRDEHRLFDLAGDDWKRVPIDEAPAEADVLAGAVLNRLDRLDRLDGSDRPASYDRPDRSDGPEADSPHRDEQVAADVRSRLEDLGYR